jgi:multiple sugar transport system substrate-binding protein
MPIWKQIIEGFEKENPDIEVKDIPNPADYWTKVLTMIASGNPPDIMMMDYIYFPSWVVSGRLEPLDNYITRDNFSLKDFVPISLKSTRYEGKQYGIPMDLNNQVMFYNTTLFKEAGLKDIDYSWTWDTFLDACKKLTKTDGSGKVIQYGYTTGLSWEPLSPWIWMNKGDWFNSTLTKCTVDSPKTVEAFEFIANLMNKYNYMPSPTRQTEMGLPDELQVFSGGKAGMYSSGFWQVSTLRTIKAFNWNIGPLPYKLLENGKPLRASTLGGVQLCILSSSKNKEAAWKFIKYRVKPEVQKLGTGLGLSMPALLSIAKSKEFSDMYPGINVKYCVEALEYTRMFPTHPYFERIDTEVGPVFDQLWLGKKTASEVCKEYTEKANKIMAGAKPFKR